MCVFVVEVAFVVDVLCLVCLVMLECRGGARERWRKGGEDNKEKNVNCEL